MYGRPTQVMHQLSEEAPFRASGFESDITSAFSSLKLAALCLNPKARPFIPGAFSHPPIPAQEGSVSSTSSRLDPAALAFAPSYSTPGSPEHGIHFQHEYSNHQDPFFDDFASANVFHGMHKEPSNFFERVLHDVDVNGLPRANYGFSSNFANLYDFGHAYDMNHNYSLPDVDPVFALHPQHAYEHHPGFGGGKYKKKKTKKARKAVHAKKAWMGEIA